MLPPGADPDSEPMQRNLNRYVIRRRGQPEDAAGIITYLASPSASWITGQTYPVNGGYSFGL
jgi:3-oxoacyl-[acyl-carrier protein] reductase